MEISSHLPEVIRQLETEAVRDGIQKRVVGSVIAVRGKILVMVRSAEDDFLAGYAEIPGGGVNGEETLIDALCRETKEETGLNTAKILDYLSSFDYLSGSGKKTRQFNFLIEPEGEDVKPDPREHSSFSWVSPQDDAALDGMPMSPEMRETIRKIKLPPSE